MKLSARNQIKGTIIAIEEGAVNAIVHIEVAGGLTITADITKASVENLGLKVGQEAYAVIKASDVMVGVE